MTNEQGGWCKEISKENSGQHATDVSLMPHLSKFLENKTVASFGDGPEAYKRELLKLGNVKSYEAFDGAPYCEEKSNRRIKFMDLTIPQYGLPMYDWIVSLSGGRTHPRKIRSNISRYHIQACTRRNYFKLGPPRERRVKSCQ